MEDLQQAKIQTEQHLTQNQNELKDLQKQRVDLAAEIEKTQSEVVVSIMYICYIFCSYSNILQKHILKLYFLGTRNRNERIGC